jgi:hypothetical protein
VLLCWAVPASSGCCPHLAVLSCSCTYFLDVVWGWMPWWGACIWQQTHGNSSCIYYAQSLWLKKSAIRVNIPSQLSENKIILEYIWPPIQFVASLISPAVCGVVGKRWESVGKKINWASDTPLVLYSCVSLHSLLYHVLSYLCVWQLPPIKLMNQVIDFHESCYKYHATKGQSTFINLTSCHQ